MLQDGSKDTFVITHDKTYTGIDMHMEGPAGVCSSADKYEPLFA